MAMDPWARTWKMNIDEKGILAGIEDREFTLELHATIGGIKIYNIGYTPESATDDPFADTKFVEFGKHLPPAPRTPLDKWQSRLKDHYQTKITEHLDEADSDILRLHGEKTVKVQGKPYKEFITMLLIPQFNKKDVNNQQAVVDLIHVICSTTAPKPPRVAAKGRAKAARQDGTAHGNPK
jgi:hypothetical protein